MGTRYLVRSSEIPAYSPANHSGTVNRRLIGPGVTDGSALEVVRGAIQPDGGASPHHHDGIEQVCYLVSGRAEVSVGGEDFTMGPGDCCYFPAGMTHRFVAVGDEPADVLVIYCPPYGEGA